ncbi:MAG: phenylalanine--tRNA ligase subunit beta [Bdellovibrionales bacterium]
MQISLKWINEYVDISDYFTKAQELGDLLTNTGIEVEEVTDLAKNYSHIILGQILELSKHPDADKLTLCQVGTGDRVVHQIVCGAKNHKQGDKVVVALPGAVLPGDFKIKQSSIRGVESNGMLCSEKELGLSEESAGILILPEDAVVGKSFAEFQGFDDILFELKVTPNRADCLSHFGLAREIATLLKRELKKPKIELEFSSDSTKSKISLNVKEKERCPRYAGRYISGVKVGPSPTWLKTRLENIGLNSINNIVDITNFVMMEMGQPLHAFDVSNISGSSIGVELSKEGELFTSLDGSEFKLGGSELLIKDGQKPVALAGVVGGKNSGVSLETKDVFVECAYFTPKTVRTTSRKHGIDTDSAYRFSRGVDASNMIYVLDRCCELICQIAGGKAFGEHHDFYPEPVLNQKFKVDTAYLSQRLGLDVSESQLKELLKQLSCEFTVSNSEFEVLAPSYRVDLNQKEDLVEEYARIHSYESVPTKMPNMSLEPTAHDSDYIVQSLVRDFWLKENYNEALNYAFVSGVKHIKTLGELDSLAAHGIKIEGESIEVLNPLNEDFGTMRSSLSPGLIENVFNNCRFGRKQGRLFEMGYTFSKTTSYHQHSRLGLVRWGSSESLWIKNDTPLVLQMKSEMESFLRRLKAKSWKWKQLDSSPSFLHPGQTAALFFEGKIVGFIGTVHPQIKADLKIKEDVAIGEFQLDALTRGQPKDFRTQKISKMPFVDRDLAFVCDESVSMDQLVDQIKKPAGKSLKSIELFDLYRGDKLDAGKKSLAFKLFFQEDDKTLSDEEINTIQEKIIQNVGNKLDAHIR